MRIGMLSICFLICSGPGLAAANQPPAAPPAPATAQAQASEPAKTKDAIAKPASAIDPAKNIAIRRLFDVQGTKDAMRQVLTGMTNNMKPLLESSLPPGEYRAKLIELFIQRFQSKLSVDQLVELAIPVYDKYFSLEEIDGLTKFYETPLGKKAISFLPQVLSETQAAGSKLGEQIGRQSMLEVLDEHPDLRKSLEDASSAKNPE